MMPGYLPEARRYLPLFDLLVLPSFTEGMPIVLLEAMAAGIPIVATAVGGVPELLQDGAGGLLVQPRRPPALAAAISQVLTDPQLVQRTTLRAREHVAEHFGSHRMAERYAEVYSRVVTEYSKGRGRRTRLSPAGTATHQAHRPNQENSPPPMPASDSKTEI
jgi:glycosyltransferase involved in cell wall biosynthesis